MTARKKSTDKVKPGRPTTYTFERAKAICEIIERTPKSLNYLCKHYEVFPPHKDTIYEWLRKHQEFSDLYAQSKQKQGNTHFEYTIELADHSLHRVEEGREITNAEIMAVRTAIDTRKWYLCKLAPKLYGDRMLLEQSNEENEQLKEELRKLRVELDKKNKKAY